jgi:hypothetical protein
MFYAKTSYCIAGVGSPGRLFAIWRPVLADINYWGDSEMEDGMTMADRLQAIQDNYLAAGEPVTEEKLQYLAQAMPEPPEPLLRLIEATRTAAEPAAEESPSGQPVECRAQKAT